MPIDYRCYAKLIVLSFMLTFLIACENQVPDGCKSMLSVREDISLMDSTWKELNKLVDNIDSYDIKLRPGAVFYDYDVEPSDKKEVLVLDWDGLGVDYYNRGIRVRINIPLETRLLSIDHALQLLREKGFKHIDVGEYNKRFRFTQNNSYGDSRFNDYNVTVVCKRTNSDHVVILSK